MDNALLREGAMAALEIPAIHEPREFYMRVVPGKPPNYDAIAELFPVIRSKPGIIFTYGDTIYNPGNVTLSQSLLAHEGTHSRRQGDKPQEWWEQYLVDKSFRLNEELLAHQIEYISAIEGHGRAVRRRTLHAIAARLSGPIYGKLLSQSEARERIGSAREAE